MMMTEKIRHRESGRDKGAYGTDYLVKCPKCGGGAQVRSGRLTCPACAHTAYNPWADPNSEHYGDAAYRPGQGGPWYGMFVPSLEGGWTPKCPSCAAPVDHDFSRRGYDAVRPTKTRITCQKCGEVHVHALSWEAIAATASPSDPIFGCTYFLIQETRYGEIFAQNVEQLADLRAFVAAGLRERREGENGWMNASYVSRLPRWIKSAKNRAAVLKACDQLLAQAAHLR